LSLVPAKESSYRKIFLREFNLHFHIPKKDQCDSCTEYRNSISKSDSLRGKYKEYHAQKKLARQAKDKVKLLAKSDKTVIAACFDFQKVLNCPHGDVSFYSRKLSLYNLSVYSVGNREAYCYMWSEIQSKRGANYIASCLLKFVNKQIQNGAKQFHFFSDNCGGQNRNRMIATLWWYMYYISVMWTVLVIVFLK